MEETQAQQKLHGFLQCTIYLMVIIEIMIFVYAKAPFLGLFSYVLDRLALIPIYHNLLYSKFATLTLICLVSIGTLSKKKVDLDPKKHILLPLFAGLLMFFGSLWLYGKSSGLVFAYTSWYNLAYMSCSLLGALVLSISMDNVSKMIRSGLGKDKWNIEEESFMQAQDLVATDCSVNIPTLFYYKGKVRSGYINLTNIYRATMVIGTPGSGKSYGVINPFIRQLLAKEFTMCLYDFKYPDLGRIAYHQFLMGRQHGSFSGFGFHVINLVEVEKSRRINVFKPAYLLTLADVTETAEALVESLKKGDSSGGSDQFFTQSAVNFLTSCIYAVSRFEEGKCSTFPHVLSFLNREYAEIFAVLFHYPELHSLLSPFKSAYDRKSFDQLEGQVGTLKIFISRLATLETFWVFSGDDFNLKLSDPSSPGILVLASDPNTQNINSTCFGVVMNRLTRLVNSKGNLPCALIVDELPTLYLHKIENLIATARSNKVAVVLGLQELTQFRQHYGKDASATIVSVVGNVLSGAVRDKDTLDWLERLLGKSVQISESLSIDRNKTSTSLNEKLESLVPAGKIASLNTGEMVGLIASEPKVNYDGQFETSAVNCRINLDAKAISTEEKQYRELPVYYDFNGKKQEILLQNFLKINQEIDALVKSFIH
ncbi:type IV secretion system DNA-binding domain-containing protein [Pedobacter sp. GR22-6]|uniref:type IV secretion system DNA-binding domain-containing protein n=1 Tax=Pedobacter sp. GR22-6 TaxID=3127957 RepID=UPI00307ED38C